MPTISVVTICFNNLQDVIDTCRVVDAQTHKPTEHWIINGSTTPDIANWLETTPQPAYRKWAAVENQHIAGNFSQGIERANCEYIHLLNSGDWYASDDVLETVHTFLQQNPQANWISANLKTLRAGIMVEIGKPFDAAQVYKGMRSISHPTWFVKKDVYNRLGVYNRAYRIAMDYDMMCRIKNEPYTYLNFTTTYFDNTGISSTKYIDSLKENVVVYEANFGYSFKCRAWQFRQKMLYLFLQTSFGKWLFNRKANITGEKSNA